jgi:hypothetical protein
MRKNAFLMTLGFCLFAITMLALAQSLRKPGLWEMTSTMTWQQSPMPAGMSMPSGTNSPFGGGPHTTQVCLTQAMIDKYGAPVPQSRNHECQIKNVVMKANSMTADWVCTGAMAGRGTVESSWTDSNHSRSKVHFTGNMQMGQDSRAIEYTIEATSVYKGPDCGSVKPMQMPSN